MTTRSKHTKKNLPVGVTYAAVPTPIKGTPLAQVEKRELQVKYIDPPKGVDPIVKRIDVTGKSESYIEKCMSGLLRNMDTDRFFVDDVEGDERQDEFDKVMHDVAQCAINITEGRGTIMNDSRSHRALLKLCEMVNDGKVGLLPVKA